MRLLASCFFILSIFLGVLPLHADEPVTRAQAVLNPTKGNRANGLVTFDKVMGGIRVTASIQGLKPGKHGLHIHEKGDCSAPDGSSVGDHYNPTHVAHGSPNSGTHHVGDLGNILADQDGVANYDRTLDFLSLNGPLTIVGRSVVIHEKEDDYTSQPSGNSGSKVACGVIQALKK